MSYAQLLTGYGPYYIIGFVVTFFTLMSSRYMLGFNIHPQERIVRVMFVSAMWLPSLIICTILTYVKRSDKLDQANSEAEELRRKLDEATQALEAASTDTQELKQSQQFADDAELETKADAPSVPKAAKKKGFISW